MIRTTIFLILFSGSIQDPGKTGVELWTTGSMHGPDLRGKTGDEWYGLFETSTGFELRPTVISVKDTETVGELYHSLVSTDQPNDPLFLVRGIPNIKVGAVKTAYRGMQFVEPNQQFSFNLFHPYPFILRAYGHADGEFIRNYELTIFHNQQRHLLVSLPYAHVEVIYPTILWIGDLDRDSKPDMYVALHSLRHALFLSSYAEPGKFLKEVALYQRTGC